MQKKLINSQLYNYKTYLMYKEECLTLAENVFNIKNISEYIDMSYVNQVLTRQGAIAFFMDDVLGLLALPFTSVSSRDVYGRPKRITVEGENGYTRTLSENEFVIMYDNTSKDSIYPAIIQYSERIALIMRTIDINVSQQKTPRFWKTSKDMERTVRDLINNVDACNDQVISYDGIDFNNTEIVLSPAPYVSDKLFELKNEIWNEFLRLIGISNLSVQKKERNIRDEIIASQGGTIASRFSRFKPREKAIKEIEKKFGVKLELEYYDGLPTTIEEAEEYKTYIGGENNV